MRLKTAIVFAALAVLVAAPTRAMTTDGQTILGIIRSTPVLQIDRSLPAPGDWNRMEHPYIRVAGQRNFDGGFIDPDYASIGRLSNGVQVMAVPLYSGGSGGIFTQLIFAQNDDSSKPYFVGYVDSGGHLAINITYHAIVAISPHYNQNDANCCPSAYDTRTYAIANGKLKLVSTHTTKTP